MKSIIIDDHSLFRHGLELILTLKLGFTQVLLAENGEQAVQLSNEHPDVNLTLLDYKLGQDNGLDVLTIIKEKHPENLVVIISGKENIHIVAASLAAGAAGFIPKSLTPDELACAIGRILQGEIFVPESNEEDAVHMANHANTILEKERVERILLTTQRIINEKDFSVRIDSSKVHEVTSAFNALLNEIETEQKKLENLAFIDELTALGNRRFFLERADLALAHARRKESVAFAFIDLDNFKAINDELGHGAGDFVLQKTAERMKHNLREVDSIARIGGDEFVFIFMGIKSVKELQETAERIYCALTRKLTLPNGTDYTPSFSVGITLTDGQESLPEVLARADKIMYDVKGNGKGHFLIR